MKRIIRVGVVVLLLALCPFAAEAGQKKQRVSNAAAINSLRNLSITIEYFYVDNGYYPHNADHSLEFQASPGVKVYYVLTGQKDKYVVYAYHDDGSIAYQIISGDVGPTERNLSSVKEEIKRDYKRVKKENGIIFLR